MEIALAEPYFYKIHGGEHSIPHYIVIYTYSLEEFYDLYWTDDMKVAYRNIRHAAHQSPHDTIRNYKYHLDKHVGLQLVQVYRKEDRDLCILHTYKLNIFKRIWRKRRALRMRQA